MGVLVVLGHQLLLLLQGQCVSVLTYQVSFVALQSASDLSRAAWKGLRLLVFTILQGCDAVLALRGKIKAGGWLRTAAKGFAVPIFSVKTSSPDHLTRAVQTILGLEPSVGGLFGSSRATNAASDMGQDPEGAGKAACRWCLHIKPLSWQSRLVLFWFC